MPVGPYADFGTCVGAQRKKGYSQDSARKICGKIEQNTIKSKQKNASIPSNIKYEEHDRLYIKAFLMDASENINNWGVHPSSLDRHISSFIGKPLVLTSSFDHPMPPDEDKVADTYYDNDKNPHNVVKINDIVDHWLAYQESFRIGNIIDITQKDSIYYAILEVTDKSAKEAFRNNDIPLFVSPAIAQLDPNEDPANITLWTGIHLALVSNPAYTIKKAIVTGQCHESADNENDNGRCLLQLRQASVIKINKDSQQKSLFGCGFCKVKALARYASVVNETSPFERSQNASSLDDFVNSSIEFSDSHSNISTKMSTSSSSSSETTNNNNNNTEQQEQQEQQQKKEETVLDKVSKGVNPSTKPQYHGRNINPETGQPYAGSVESLTPDELGIRLAGMEECVQIFVQNGVQQDQSVQICKLAAKALMENQPSQQQQPGAGGGNRPSPGISGQFGQIADYEKEIAKQEVKIGQLMDELKQYKKGDKTDAQRIAELEDTVSTLHRTIKEKEIEAYLVTKIGDEELRSKKIKRFADLNMTIEDLKDIYDNTDPKVVTAPAKKQVASVVANNNNEVPNPIGKVKLQVASANNNNTNNNEDKPVNEIRERNNRISSLLLKRGLE